MSERKCSICGKIFQKHDLGQIADLADVLGSETSGQLCYDCALQKVTGGSCPEEGDFNTARLISGEITDQELQWLQEDLRSVESGCSSCVPDYCQEDEDDYEEYDRY